MSDSPTPARNQREEQRGEGDQIKHKERLHEKQNDRDTLILRLPVRLREEQGDCRDEKACDACASKDRAYARELVLLDLGPILIKLAKDDISGIKLSAQCLGGGPH